MSSVKICRICLKFNVKLYKHNSYQLEMYYQQILPVNMKDDRHLPRYFCYECAALLFKFHKFKEKCSSGQKLFKKLMSKGALTLKSVKSMIRKNESLHSYLSIITVSNRVKTYVIRSQDDISDISDDDIENTMDYHDSKNDLDDNPEIFVDEPMIDQTEHENLHVNKDLKLETVFAEEFDEPLDNNEDDTENCDTEDKYVHKISNDQKKKAKAKKFEVNDKKKTVLDPNYWLKFTLTEDEALKEFKLRGEHSRYLSAEYKCTDCLKGFSKQDILDRHLKLGHSESIGPIECRFCRMRFKWKCYLTRHMKQHYTKFKCLRCDLVCPLEKTAIFHEEYHNGVTRKCKHCGEEFKHLNTYYTHLRTHPSEHVCTLCGASFVSNMGLFLHKKFKHPGEVSEVPHGEGEYCERCDIRFETRKAFEEHLIHSAKHVDGKDDEEIKLAKTLKPRKRRLEVRRTIPTDCHICGQHFDTQSAYRKHHLAAHPGTSIFAPHDRQICEICGASVVPGTMTTHHLSHSNEKTVQCTLCDRKFKQTSSMKLHYRSFHEKDITKKDGSEKKFTCATCGMQLTTKNSLKRHLLTHTGEKPFECTLCDKRFTQKNSMQLHYRTFHLKEPYPKRNRRKKGDAPETTLFEEYRNEDESEGSLKIDRWR